MKAKGEMLLVHISYRYGTFYASYVAYKAEGTLKIKCISPPGCRRRGCNLPVKGAPTRPARVFVLCVLMQPWVCDAPLKTFARVPVLQSAVLFCPAAAASGLRVIGRAL